MNLRKVIANFIPYYFVKAYRGSVEKKRVGDIKKEEHFVNMVTKCREKFGGINLNIGGGAKSSLCSGYINMDLARGSDLKVNILEGLPFEDFECSSIYSSHFFEHLKQRDIISVLKECFRTLKKDGEIYICVPDGQLYINAFLGVNPKVPLEKKDLVWASGYFVSDIDWINYICHMDGHHKHIFNFENLKKTLELVGFREVQESSLKEHKLNLEHRDFESIYVKAYKR